MSNRERRLEELIEEERRLRRAAVVAAQGQPPEPDESRAEEDAEDAEDDAAAKRMEQQALWVDLQIRRAMERGDFDNLPGAGKPIRGLGGAHDPDWWLKSLIERERITGVLPPALALRKEDAELDQVLDREATEQDVRRAVQDFNRRVVDARRQLTGGPPVVTPTREEDAEVAAWRQRRVERREQQRRLLEATPATSDVPKDHRQRWRLSRRRRENPR